MSALPGQPRKESLGAGQSVTDIAESLQLSVKTVSTYRERILEKLKLENNYQLIRYVLENYLLEQPCPPTLPH